MAEMAPDVLRRQTQMRVAETSRQRDVAFPGLIHVRLVGVRVLDRYVSLRPLGHSALTTTVRSPSMISSFTGMNHLPVCS